MLFTSREEERQSTFFVERVVKYSPVETKKKCTHDGFLNKVATNDASQIGRKMAKKREDKKIVCNHSINISTLLIL